MSVSDAFRIVRLNLFVLVCLSFLLPFLKLFATCKTVLCEFCTSMLIKVSLCWDLFSQLWVLNPSCQSSMIIKPYFIILAINKVTLKLLSCFSVLLSSDEYDVCRVCAQYATEAIPSSNRSDPVSVAESVSAFDTFRVFPDSRRLLPWSSHPTGSMGVRLLTGVALEFCGTCFGLGLVDLPEYSVQNTQLRLSRSLAK